MKPEVNFTVSAFIDVCNQALEYDFTGVNVEGEVASFKVNQNKWVFFDLKDQEDSISCFMPLSQLRTAITDGMRVRVRVTPRLTRWGKFSLTVQGIMPLGEGNIKKSFELLKQKLAKEGLFDLAKKRPLPTNIAEIGIISSTSAAGYIDFLKILSNRWGGLKISTINTQVQGMQAANQIIKALEYFNQQRKVDVIAILRGGGSADDLAAFNDECLARTIAASRIPVITGIGHEVDESLADLAADVRASTPSNAAERLVPDRHAIKQQVELSCARMQERLLSVVAETQRDVRHQQRTLQRELLHRIDKKTQYINETIKAIEALNPDNALRRGYAIITSASHKPAYQAGDVVKITTYAQEISAKVESVTTRKGK